MYPESIKNLIESFKFFPGIGEKTAERMAFASLDLEEEQVELFSQSLVDIKKKIHKCSKCGTLTENDLCFVCSDDTRDKKIVYKESVVVSETDTFSGSFFNETTNKYEVYNYYGTIVNNAILKKYAEVEKYIETFVK